MANVGTIRCGGCGRDVPWTAEKWDSAQQRCRDCTGSQLTSHATPQEIASSPAPHRGGIAVRITGVDIPFGDLFMDAGDMRKLRGMVQKASGTGAPSQ